MAQERAEWRDGVAIDVRGLRKVYTVPEREGGLRAAAGRLFRRRPMACRR